MLGVAINNRQATAIFHIRKNSRPWKDGCQAAVPRNETLRSTRQGIWEAPDKIATPQPNRGKDARPQPSETASPQGTPKAKPPKSKSALPSSTASMRSAPLRSSVCHEQGASRRKREGHERRLLLARGCWGADCEAHISFRPSAGFHQISGHAPDQRVFSQGLCNFWTYALHHFRCKGGGSAGFAAAELMPCRAIACWPRMATCFTHDAKISTLQSAPRARGEAGE